jgi:hypothetical protein
MHKSIFVVLLLAISTTILNAQIERIEPAFWWVGMKNPKLQLLIHGKDISKNQVTISYPGVKIVK